MKKYGFLYLFFIFYDVKIVYTQFMRLDRFLCETAAVSRSEAKAYIKGGRVTVDGFVARSGDVKVDPEKSKVSFDGIDLKYVKFVYFMLNKPAGFVSATKDAGKTVIDLLKSENRDDLFPVGRLDKDTTGLLIITNDGDLGHHLTSPKHGILKKYLVKIEHSLSEADKSALSEGLDIGNGERSGKATVEVISDDFVYITVSEGKFHEIKRMLKAVGNEVLELKRVSMGGVALDESLKEGEYRRLLPSEIERLNEHV